MDYSMEDASSSSESDSCSGSSSGSSSLASSQPPMEMSLEKSNLGESAATTSFISDRALSLRLAAVRARTKCRTQFALQAIAASKATLEATDALIAASDALLAAPRPPSGYDFSSSPLLTPERKLQQSSDANLMAITSSPESVDASDSSKPETQALQAGDERMELGFQTPQQMRSSVNATKNNEDLSSSDAQEVYFSSEGSSSYSSSSGESSSSGDVSSSSTMEVETSDSKDSHAMSVDLLLKGNIQSDHVVPAISGSLLSGCFEKKTIPEFVLSGPDAPATVVSEELTASPESAAAPSYSTLDAPATVVSEELTASPESAAAPSNSTLEEEKDDNDCSQSSEEGAAEEVSSSSSENITTTVTSDAASESPPSNVEKEDHVKELLGELGGVQMASITPQSPLPPTPLQPALHQVQSIIQPVLPPQQLATTTPQPSTPLQPASHKAQSTIQPQQLAAAAAPPQQLVAPHQQSKPTPLPQEEEDDSSDEAGSSSTEDSSSEEDSSESASSFSPQEIDESDTGRPGTSTDVEEDDYVAELLSELKMTKGAMNTGVSKAPRSPPQVGVTESLLTSSKTTGAQSVATASITTATTAPETTMTTSTPSKQQSALQQPPTMPQKDENGGKDATEEESFLVEKSSCASSSMGSSSLGEEDDEYVDELLNELNAAKPKSLLPPQMPPKNKPTSVAGQRGPTSQVPVGIDSSSSDDDISSSSDYDSSYDSDIFSIDGEDDSPESSDEGHDRGDSTGNYASSDDYTSGGEDEYVDDLLHELQAPRPPAAPKGAAAAAAALVPPGMGGGFLQPPPGKGAVGLPGEGLNLDAIRSELEKVGRAVMTQKSGEAFVARAQILASINQLSSHVPNCVLDFLGKEIKARMKWQKEKSEKKETKTKEPEKHKLVDVVSSYDDMSEVSDLSEIDTGIADGEENSNMGLFIDISAVNLDEDLKGRGKGGPKDAVEEKPISSGLMRKKSEQALDEMFKQAREDGSLNHSKDLSDDINFMFKDSNDYGLTKPRSVTSFGESSKSESSESKGADKFKAKSRAGSGASMTWGTDADAEGKLPSVSRFECALLFVDISGFTKLSTLLDPETLSKVINSYFQLIVSKIYEYHGDIQKFAGDAIFAEWRCCEKEPMEWCVAAATACASQIVDECSDFPVMAGGAQSRTGEPISSLNVHCALGSGQMMGIHVGDNTRRREYLFLGEPIDQLTWGADLAKNGELVVSPEAFRSLSLAGVLDFDIRPSEREPAIIAKRGVTMFKSDKFKDFRISRAEYAKSRGVTGHVEGLEVEDLKLYQQLMALYVHPVVAATHLEEKSKMKSKSSAQERHREEAELRRVYIMFIHPIITISEENDFAVDLLNEIMKLTSTQLERYCGHLRQMIVDDKGLVLIGTFGLRGSTFPNMVAERALPATLALHNALQSQLGVDNRIGATFGEVYCGAVGGVKRHEYAVLGPSANLAARLMGNKNNPGILVECNIRRMASRKYAFNALPPVKAKGYAEPVPIYEPLSPLERSWGRIQPNFVGREQEIKALMGMARDIVSASEPKSRLVFVASQSGMGKSTTVAHAIEHIRNLIGDNTRRLVITKHVGKESVALLPFGMFRSILLDVLVNFAANTDDRSHVSGVSGFTSQSPSLHSLSARSQGSSTALSVAKSEELLKVLCRELNAPSGFVEHVMRHLSGQGPGKPPSSGKAPSMKSMVSFMLRAFRRCTEETKLVVVALDDVQYIDEMTWKVLRQVFEGCDNVLMVCAFDLSRSRDLRVEADFWQVLDQKYRPSGHFVPMELGGLGKEEITLMTMKTLGLQREEISHDLLNEVLIQSGGMPHFANEFLEMAKRRQFNEMMDGRADGSNPKLKAEEPKTMGPNALGSVPEIILHRIDSFDVAVRNILNIGAVLGKSFILKEVTAVLKENHDMREDVLEKEATASLEMAVNEGILRLEENSDKGDEGSKSEDGDSASDKAENTVYSFYHSIWQTTILSLMLDARKKDVHRKIALGMEKEKERDGSDFAFQMKLLGHWKSSGNTTKLTELALEVGKHFEQNLSMPTQSIRVYEEALDTWKESKPSDKIGGISLEALDAMEPEELQHISALHVALGRSLSGARRNADSALSFHDALRVLRVPLAASKVGDLSTSFPAYYGLYECVKAKHVLEKDGNRYEQLLVKKFLADTKQHPEQYHHAHAITCQMDLYRRKGDMKMAVGIQKVLYNVYDHVEHNKKLKETYGSDEAALSFSNSAMWHWQLGDKEAALDACRHVIGKLMPKMDRSDVHQSFVMMYPVVLVMKETGVAVQARKHFDRLVVKPFNAFFGEGKSSFFLPVYDPICYLLDLVGTPDLDEDTLEEYAEWALNRDALSFGTLANRRLGALGRCADSLSAEICFLLAERIDEEETRRILTEFGKEIAEEALVFNKEQSLTVAEHQVKALLDRYQSLMAELDGDFDSDQEETAAAPPRPPRTLSPRRPPPGSTSPVQTSKRIAGKELPKESLSEDHDNSDESEDGDGEEEDSDDDEDDSSETNSEVDSNDSSTEDNSEESSF